MMDCAAQAGGLPVAAVENEPWQKRARRAGLTQAELARLSGRRENAISEGLQGKGKGGVPVYLKTIIRLWERSMHTDRETVLQRPDVDADTP